MTWCSLRLGKVNHCSVMGFQGNLTGHLRMYAGRERKGCRVEKMKRGVEVWIRVRACLSSCLPSCHLPFPLAPGSGKPGASEPLCRVLPVCDFPKLPLELITDLESTTDLLVSTADLELTNDLPVSTTDLELTTDKCLENTQAFELSINMQSRNPSFVEEATDATVDYNSSHTEFFE